MPCEPRAQRGYISVFEEEDRARHAGRVCPKAARKVKGIHFPAAKVTLGRCHSVGSGGGYNGPAALGAQRVGKHSRQALRTIVAERDYAPRVEGPCADPARRGKRDRGKGLAHPAEMGPNGIGDTGHGTPSLRPREVQGKRKMIKLARFVPIA